MRSIRLLFYSLALPVARKAAGVTAAFSTHVAIPRLSIEDFSRYYNNNNNARETPIIIEHVMSEQQCEAICESIVSQPSLAVQLQRRRPNVATDVYPMDIQTAIEYIMLKSSHTDALWCFQEGLLEDCKGLHDMRQQLAMAKESLFEDVDWFQYFPTHLIPSDCVILAGEGSTSTLHRDPFEWTGTSLCLEGSKLWRFIEPPQDNVLVVDQLLNSYRLESSAWDESNHDVTLSAGWQSDYKLYAHRHESIPSARKLNEMDEHVRQNFLYNLASSPTLLQANVEHSLTVWSTVQQTGDLLVIPAHWWHQTYAVEPSVAVASQRCSGIDARRVMQHMVDTTRVDLNVDQILNINAAKKSVDTFFSKLQESVLALK